MYLKSKEKGKNKTGIPFRKALFLLRLMAKGLSFPSMTELLFSEVYSFMLHINLTIQAETYLYSFAMIRFLSLSLLNFICEKEFP